MRPDLSDITVVLDRSGSMGACKKEAENGLNGFIRDQKLAQGSTNFTLVQFDTEYEFVYRGTDIKNVEPHQLDPRGNTALLDAVGRAINETGQRLKDMAETDRPNLVVFVIVTDGQENSSQEFTLARVKEMIEHQRNTYNWQFTFLGANQDAFAEAGAMGISANAAANFSAGLADRAFLAATQTVGRMRMAAAAGDEVQNFFTPEEREEMVED